MKDQNPFPFSSATIATTIIALVVVGGLFSLNRVSVKNQKLIEEKQTEISKIESSNQTQPPQIQPLNNQDLVDMKQQRTDNNSNNIAPTTEPLPYYPDQVNQSNPKTQSKPPAINPSANYIDIGWSTAQNWVAKMPENSIALTFDDGPNPEYTPQILDILKKHQIKATFFLVGKRVQARCDLVRRIVAEGHEIANHSYTHPFLTKLSPAAQKEEMEKTQQVINNCVGFRPLWLRTPYGDQSEAILKIAHEVGLNTVLWSIDTQDWNKESSAEKIINSALQSNGQDIILMHDSTESTVDYSHQFQHSQAAKTREATIKALDPMIEEMERRNLKFVTISEAFLSSN